MTMSSMNSTVYVDDIREIKEENPFESMMSRFDRALSCLISTRIYMR